MRTFGLVVLTALMANFAFGQAGTVPAGVRGQALFEEGRKLEAAGKGPDAVKFYRRAVLYGSGKAANRLGEIYDVGIPGVGADFAESLKWFNTARALGEDVPRFRDPAYMRNCTGLNDDALSRCIEDAKTKHLPYCTGTRRPTC